MSWRKSAKAQAEATAEIIACFAPEARKELGLEVLMLNQCVTNPAKFLCDEVFQDAAAFEAHQGRRVSGR